MAQSLAPSKLNIIVSSSSSEPPSLPRRLAGSHPAPDRASPGYNYLFIVCPLPSALTRLQLLPGRRQFLFVPPEPGLVPNTWWGFNQCWGRKEGKKDPGMRWLLEVGVGGPQCLRKKNSGKQSKNHCVRWGPWDEKVKMLVGQSCPTLQDPTDNSSSSSSAHGIFPGKNTGMGCHCLLQGIFSTKRLNPCLPCLLLWWKIPYPLSHWEAPLGGKGKINFASVSGSFGLAGPPSWYRGWNVPITAPRGLSSVGHPATHREKAKTWREVLAWPMDPLGPAWKFAFTCLCTGQDHTASQRKDSEILLIQAGFRDTWRHSESTWTYLGVVKGQAPSSGQEEEGTVERRWKTQLYCPTWRASRRGWRWSLQEAEIPRDHTQLPCSSSEHHIICLVFSCVLCWHQTAPSLGLSEPSSQRQAFAGYV